MRFKQVVSAMLACALCAGLAGCGRETLATEIGQEDPEPSKPEVSLSASMPDEPAAPDAPEGVEGLVQSVKEKLSLDTEKYDTFRSEEETDPLEARWTFYWTDSGTGDSLEVLVNGDGLILGYARYDASVSASDAGDLPRFPVGNARKAHSAGFRLAQQCLADGETLTMSEEPLVNSLSSTSYRFHGDIQLNGLSAGIGCDVTVRASDNAVTSFRRTDWRGLMRDEIPDPEASVGANAAKEKFFGTIALEMEYVLPQDGSKEACLIYRPVNTDTYYVDAKTGELVNLTQLANKIKAPMYISSDDYSKGMNTMAEADDAEYGATGSLTGAETLGLERMADAMSREELDAAARKMAFLGLDGYTLSGIAYQVSDLTAEDAEDRVSAVITYARPIEDEGNTWRRTVTLDARTGALERVYSSAYGSSENAKSMRKLGLSEAQEKADAFLSEICGKQAARCVVTDKSDIPEDSGSLSFDFTYNQKENGYFYHGNYINVSVDATDGSISSYQNCFDDEVTFESPEGVLDSDAAAEAWLDTYQIVLRYVQVPFAIDAAAPEYDVLKDTGISYMYSLVTGYSMERAGTVSYIRARDGEPVRPAWSEDTGYTYDDVGSSSELDKMISRLAKYNVGLSGGSFRAGDDLTVSVLDELLDAMDGTSYYRYWDVARVPVRFSEDDTVLNRGEAVKRITERLFPAEMLSWSKIYKPGFGDGADIPDDLIGCAAVAGVSGMMDIEEDFDAGGRMTRGDAARMIYGFLARFE